MAVAVIVKVRFTRGAVVALLVTVVILDVPCGWQRRDSEVPPFDIRMTMLPGWAVQCAAGFTEADTN